MSMSIEEIVLLSLLIIIIIGVMYITFKRVRDFDELKKAVILQDLNLIRIFRYEV